MSEEDNGDSEHDLPIRDDREVEKTGEPLRLKGNGRRLSQRHHTVFKTCTGAGLLHLAPLTFGWDSSLSWGCPAHRRLLGSIPGLHPPGARSTSPSRCDTQTCLWTLPAVPWGAEFLLVDTTALNQINTNRDEELNFCFREKGLFLSLGELRQSTERWIKHDCCNKPTA